MTHATLKPLLPVLAALFWLPAAVLAQGNAPLTGSMAAPAGTTSAGGRSLVVIPPAAATAGASTVRTAADTPVVTAVPDSVPVAPQPPVATAQASNSGPVWKIEVPLSGQTAQQSGAAAARSSPANTPAVVTASPSASGSSMASRGDSPSSNSGGWKTPHERVGDTTSALLTAQAQGTYAGKQLDTLGAAAGLSYERYLDSFKQPIPQWFKQAVDADKGGGQ